MNKISIALLCLAIFFMQGCSKSAVDDPNYYVAVDSQDYPDTSWYGTYFVNLDEFHDAVYGDNRYWFWESAENGTLNPIEGSTFIEFNPDNGTILCELDGKVIEYVLTGERYQLEEVEP